MCVWVRACLQFLVSKSYTNLGSLKLEEKGEEEEEEEKYLEPLNPIDYSRRGGTNSLSQHQQE